MISKKRNFCRLLQNNRSSTVVAHFHCTDGPNLSGPGRNKFVCLLFWPIVNDGVRFPPALNCAGVNSTICVAVFPLQSALLVPTDTQRSPELSKSIPPRQEPEPTNVPNAEDVIVAAAVGEISPAPIRLLAEIISSASP